MRTLGGHIRLSTCFLTNPHYRHTAIILASLSSAHQRIINRMIAQSDQAQKYPPLLVTFLYKCCIKCFNGVLITMQIYLQHEQVSLLLFRKPNPGVESYQSGLLLIICVCVIWLWGLLCASISFAITLKCTLRCLPAWCWNQKDKY